jgi:hypothetical protein
VNRCLRRRDHLVHVVGVGGIERSQRCGRQCRRGSEQWASVADVGGHGDTDPRLAQAAKGVAPGIGVENDSDVVRRAVSRQARRAEAQSRDRWCHDAGSDPGLQIHQGSVENVTLGELLATGAVEEASGPSC